MDDATHPAVRGARSAPYGTVGRRELPAPTNEERSFWRRAVEIERARLGRPRPTPFPFQEA